MNETMDMISGLTDFDALDIPGAIAGDHEIVEYQPPEIPSIVSNPGERKIDLDTDYAKARDTVNFQQELLKLALLKQFENANTSDAPRQMEVLATLSTQLTNSTKQLLDIQKQMKDITQEQITTGQQTGGTQIKADTVYVGSPTDMLNEVGTRQEFLREEKVINGEAEEVRAEDKDS